MITVEDIFEKFDTAANLGRVIGRNGIRAAEMRKRGSIPSRYWAALVEAAKERDIEGVTFETLAIANENSAKAKKRDEVAA
jgi:hypothetical protein